MPLLALSRRRVWPLALLAVLLAVAGTVVVSLWLAMERQPRVDAPGNAVSLDDVARARDLLRHNDPRRALPGITRAVVLSQRDLELLLQQAGQRLGGAAQTARGRVRLQPGKARLLEGGVVVVVQVVEADDFVAAIKQAMSDVRTDEAGGAGDERGHAA